MTLRRFPWKCPKSNDNSFKLFVTQPTEDELNSSLYPGRVTPQTKSEPASRMPSDSTESSHRHHHNKSEPVSHRQNSTADDKSTVAVSSDAVSSSTATLASSAAPSEKPSVIKGPWRLLRLLPRETRHIVSRMLELDPDRRASIDEVSSDPWVAKTLFCRQEVGGQLLWAEGHQHVLATSDENTEVKYAKRPWNTPAAAAAAVENV